MRVVLSFAMALLGAACPPPAGAVCGNGIVDDGEDAESCCVDAGCLFGTCSERACREAWQEQCAVEGVCAGALLCAGVNATPSYDCAACPCPGADACYEGVCIDAATRDLERDADVVADNLDMDEYARIFATLAALDAIPLGEAAPTLATRLRADSRTTTLLVGADAAMDGEDLTAVLVVIVAATGFTEATRLDLRARRADACAQVASASSAGVLPSHFVVAIVPTDAASHATCAFPGTFAHCDIPMGEDCVLRAGRLSVAVVVVEQKIVMPAMDQAMLLRAGLAPPEVLDAFLAAALTAFEGARSPFPLQEGFRIGERFVAAYIDGDDMWLVLADANARPDKTRTFRVVWNDPPSQAYLIDHDIQARDCAFEDAAADRIIMTCNNGGFTLTATVESADLRLVDVRQDP